MGVVVAATHLGLGQSVAVKLMLPDLATSAELSARFLREARAAAAIHGDHAVRIFDVAAAADGMLYMVMELLEGEDLGHLINRHGALPIAQAVDYILQACDALGDAHAQGIVHRDLKPGNLFLAQSSKGPPILKVLDFGISKSNQVDGGQSGPTLTAPDSMLGTPYYMSPEQFRSAKTVDARADIWSLGLILHKLITGFSAFESDSVREHISMIAADPPAPLRLRRPDAPEGLEAIVLRCLEKDVSLRYQSVSELAAELAPFGLSRPRTEVLVEPQRAVASSLQVRTSSPARETTTPTGNRSTRSPETATATTITSSIPRPFLIPRPTWRVLLAGALPAALLFSAGITAIEGGAGGAAPIVAAPSTSLFASARPASSMPVLSAAVLASGSAAAAAASSSPTPSAPSARASSPRAAGPPALRTPLSPVTASDIKNTPRPSLTTFQPSDL